MAVDDGHFNQGNRCGRKLRRQHGARDHITHFVKRSLMDRDAGKELMECWTCKGLMVSGRKIRVQVGFDPDGVVLHEDANVYECDTCDTWLMTQEEDRRLAKMVESFSMIKGEDNEAT